MAEQPTVTTARERRKILSAGGFAHFVHDGLSDAVFVLLPLWASGFGLSHAQVGILKTCMSSTLAAGQVPAGFVAERLGERAVLALGTGLAGLGFVALAVADDFLMLAAFLCLAGIGCSTQHPLASALVSKAYAAGGRRGALGIYNFSGDLGKVATPIGIATIAGWAGWQTGVVVYGVVGAVAGAAIYFALRRLGAGAPPPSAPATAEARPQDSGLGWGVRDRRGFSILSAIACIDTSARIGFLTFAPFLLIEKGAATESVGFALTLILAGGAAGKLVCGFVADRVGILRTVVLTELATAGLIAAVIVLPLVPALVVLPVLGVALNGTSSVLYGTVGDFVDPARQARAFGLFYTLSIGASAVAPVLYGLLGDFAGLTTALAVLAAGVLTILPLAFALRAPLAAAETAAE